jgi:deoxycytidylate deaminase
MSLSNSSIISKDIATRYYKIALQTAYLLSNECERHHRHGCIIVTSDTFTTLATGVTTCIFSDPTKHVDKRILLYTITAVEDAITRAVKLGGISLNNSIAIVTEFPDITSIKLLIQSGIKTIITSPYTSDKYINANYRILLESLDVIIINDCR